MGATIRDVAREAGVSTATVSRVFNASGPVSEATQARIREVAKRLRYAPNGAARSLITNRTHTLGVLLPDLYGEFFSEVIRGIDQAAQGNDFHLLLSSSHTNRSRLGGALRAMRGRVDGLVVMYPDIDVGVLRSNLSDRLPVVLMNCRVPDGAFESINIDNFGGSFAMVRHLIEHGHGRIGIIKGAARNYDAAERLRGYRSALAEAGLPHDPALEVEGAFTESSGYRAAEQLLGVSPRPTAIFAGNDAMAVGAFSAVRRAGLRVPDDVAVAGFDDIPMAAYMTPSLASVHVPMAELGARAIRRLIEGVREKNDNEHRQELLPIDLVPRASCGCRDADAAWGAPYLSKTNPRSY